MRKFMANAPDTVVKALGKKAKQHFAMFDSVAELGDHFVKVCKDKNGKYDKYWKTNAGNPWYGEYASEETVKRFSTGDSKNVAASDKLMTKFEEVALATPRPSWANDVAGGRPDVQAYISGHPLAMKRRVRDESAYAPMAIVFDVTTSAGLNAEHILRRGAAMLALLRVLSARRPVELWIGTNLCANGGNACAIYARINTSPLDLTTSAFILTDAGFARQACYGIGQEDYGFEGSWPFYDATTCRKYMKDLMAPAFAHVVDTLCIPGAFLNDPSIETPEAWVAEKVEQYAPSKLGY